MPIINFLSILPVFIPSKLEHLMKIFADFCQFWEHVQGSNEIPVFVNLKFNFT